MGLNNLQTGGTGGISPGGLRNLTEISTIPDSEVLDDWADNQLTSRDSFDTTPYQFEAEDDEKFAVAGSRPEWSGSAAVSDQTVTITDLDPITTTQAADPTAFENGLAYEIRVPSGATANGHQVRFWREDANNYWELFLDVRSGAGPRLDKIVSGSRTTGVIQGSELPDGFIARVEHDGVDSWEVLVDGASEGTATDSFAPAANETEINYSGTGSGEVNSYAVWPRQE